MGACRKGSYLWKYPCFLPFITKVEHGNLSLATKSGILRQKLGQLCCPLLIQVQVQNVQEYIAFHPAISENTGYTSMPLPIALENLSQISCPYPFVFVKLGTSVHRNLGCLIYLVIAQSMCFEL